MITFVEELKFGEGVKGYRLEVRRDQEREQKIYDAGVKLEDSLQDAGSVAHQVLARLSVFPTRAAETPETQEESNFPK
jgi:hypothetical protein